MRNNLIYCLMTCILLISASDCNEKNISKKPLKKIEFDYSVLDKDGMLTSVAAVDYEFCIPKDDKKVSEIKAIEPNVQIPAMAKGRIGCSKDEYLCIVSTRGDKWKDKLYAIASLPYVKRIIQTHYE